MLEENFFFIKPALMEISGALIWNDSLSDNRKKEGLILRSETNFEFSNI